MMNIRKPKAALKFKKPSSWWGAMWRGAVPTGNGKIGASVFGGVSNETILINHKSLNWQGYTGVLQDVADKLPNVRKLVTERKTKEAEQVLTNELVRKGYRPQVSVPLPLCNLKVTQLTEKPAKEYMRVLNMENGEVSVVFKDGTTKFDRSMFVSRDNDIICYEITKSGSKPINVELSLDVHDKTNNRTSTAVSKVPEAVFTKYESYFMFFSARGDSGTDFGAVSRVMHYGGNMSATANSIRITGAERVFVLTKVFIESQREKEWKELRNQLTTVKDSYDKLLKSHTAAHSKLFGVSDFDLENSGRDTFVEDLLEQSQNGELSSALLEKLWYFGRFLFVASSAEAGEITNPYGLWCGDFKAEDSHPTADGLIQMLYGIAGNGGVPELMMPIFNYYEQYTDDLKKNAMRLYGCKGIFVPSIVSPQSALMGSVLPQHVHFVASSALVANLFYDYYLFTSDAKFLKARALPFMKEVAAFYAEFFKLDQNGFYTTIPSYSPNTLPGNFVTTDKEMNIAQNSMIDFVAVKTLLLSLIEGSREAGVNKDDIAKWEDMLKKIPSYQTNTDGCIKEYVNVGSAFLDNYNNERLSHLMCFNENNPDLIKAASLTAKKRMQMGAGKQTALSLASMASLYARLGDGESTLDTLYTMARSVITDNLTTVKNDWRGLGYTNDSASAPYHLEGNIGITNALNEMFVQSDSNTIKILPAITNTLTKGEITRVGTRCGTEVDVVWDAGKGSLTVKIKSKKNTKVNIVLPECAKKFKNVKGLEIPVDRILKNFDLVNGKQAVLEFICKF